MWTEKYYETLRVKFRLDVNWSDSKGSNKFCESETAFLLLSFKTELKKQVGERKIAT